MERAGTNHRLRRLMVLSLLATLLVSCQHWQRARVKEFSIGYFRDPQPDRIAWFMREVWKLDLNLGGVRGTIGFLAVIFRDNPGRLDVWTKSISNLSAQHRGYVWEAFWYAGTEEARSVLREVSSGPSRGDAHIAARFLQTIPPSLHGIPIRNGADLDFLWGCYEASGGAQFVIAITEVLNWEPLGNGVKVHGNALNRAAVPYAAAWSLQSQATRYPEVRAILEAELKRSRGRRQKALECILAGDPWNECISTSSG
jgi:hypothetical protein